MKQYIPSLILAFVLVSTIGYASELKFDHREIFFDHACSYYKFYYDGIDLTKELNTLKVEDFIIDVGSLSNPKIEWIEQKQESYFDVKTNKTIVYKVDYWKSIAADIALLAKDNTVIDSKITEINANGYKVVRFCADIKRTQTKNGWSILADHIPEFAGVKYDKFDIWNNSFNYRKNVTFTDTKGYNLINAYTSYQFNHEGHADASCNDIFVSDENGKNVQFNITGCGANYVTITQKYNVTALGSNNYYVWYGNSTPIGASGVNAINVSSLGDSDYLSEEDGNTNGWELIYNTPNPGVRTSNAGSYGNQGKRYLHLESGGQSALLWGRADRYAAISLQQPKSIEFFFTITSGGGAAFTTLGRASRIMFLNQTNETVFGFYWGNNDNGIYWDAPSIAEAARLTSMKTTTGDPVYNVTIDDIKYAPTCTADIYINNTKELSDVPFHNCSSQNISAFQINNTLTSNPLDEKLDFDNFKVRHPTTISFTAEQEGNELTLKAYYEKNSTAITCWDVLISNATDSKTITCLNNTAHKNVTGDLLPTGSITITFSKSGFYSRNYYATLYEGSVVSITSYLLETTDTNVINPVRFHILTVAGASIIGADVKIQKLIGSTYTTISEQLTTASGTASFALDSTVNYKIIVTATGYQTYTTYETPSVNDYNLYLIPTSTSSNYSSLLDDIYFTHSPLDYWLWNTSQLFNFTIISSNNSLVYYGFRIGYSNGSTICNQYGTSASGGTLSCTYDLNSLNLNSTYSNQTLNMTIFFNKTSYYTNYTQNYNFNIYFTSPSNSTLDHVLKYFDTYGFDPNVKYIIIVFLVLISSGLTAGIGFGLEGGSIVGVFVLAIFAMVGWIDPVLFMFIAIIATAFVTKSLGWY